MRNITQLFFLALVSFSAFSQPSDKERQKVLDEGTRLYRSEMASWYGTDVFLAKFKDRTARTGGYFSYVDNDKATCVFFSKESLKKVIATITFDDTYNVNTAVISGEERDLTPLETDLVEIRTIALEEFKTDRNLFKTYQKMNPNFIPLIDKQGKRVYVLTGPEENNIVVFGNDYLLTFDKHNKLKAKKQIHANIIPIRTDSADTAVATIHSHLTTTGNLITPTDICTLMLYCKFVKWRQHYVISPKYVSIWKCGDGLVAVMPRKAWDNIGKDKVENKN